MKASMALLAAALTVLLTGCERHADAPIAPAAAASAEAIAPPASTDPTPPGIDTARRQADCDQAGQNALQNASIDPAFVNSVSASYNPRSQRCNVLLEARATDPARALTDVSRALIDGDSGQLLGSTKIEGQHRSALILETGVTDFDEASLYIDRQMSGQ